MVREKGGMSTVAKIGVGLVVCYAALHVLPVIFGASVVVGFLGMALASWLLSLALYVGVPIFALVFLISLFTSSDD